MGNKIDFSTEKDSYQFTEFIASGGQGHVLKATSLKTNKTVCVKKFKCSPNQVDSMMNEIKITRSLQHPHIVPIIDAISQVDKITGGEIAYVMPFCEFGTLADLEFPLSKKLVFQVMYQLTCALEYIHEKHIIHRDLKPQNILIEKLTKDEISILLADFGFSRNFEISRTMTVLGTLGYMSPEMIQTGKYGSSTDIYSFGCILFELITGKKYSHSKTSNDKIIFPKEYHEDFTNFVLRMLSNDPKQRPTAKMIKDFVKPLFTGLKNPSLDGLYYTYWDTFKDLSKLDVIVTQHKLNIVTVGQMGGGRSTMLHAYQSNNTCYEPGTVILKSTGLVLPCKIGVNFFKKTLQIGNNDIELSIYDTAGQERYRTILSIYLRMCDVAIISVDVTSSDWNSVDGWIDFVKDIKKKILIGTKCDLPKKIWKVSNEQLREIAKSHGCVYIPTSTLMYKNIDLVFNLATFMGAVGNIGDSILALNSDTSIDF